MTYEAYIDLMEDVCFEEYLLHPFTGKEDPEWEVPDLVIANRTAVEDFIRDNLLSPREMALSALAAAQANGVDYLWLDCWAYRTEPYVHLHFVKTLATVMAQVHLVK